MSAMFTILIFCERSRRLEKEHLDVNQAMENLTSKDWERFYISNQSINRKDA